MHGQDLGLRAPSPARFKTSLYSFMRADLSALRILFEIHPKSVERFPLWKDSGSPPRRDEDWRLVEVPCEVSTRRWVIVCFRSTRMNIRDIQP